MVISFTGPQSAGKSTLLELCKKEFGDRFSYVEEVTRFVKREYGVSINEAGDNQTQLLILNQHLVNSIKHPKDVIMDRCIVDGVIYTNWLCKEGKVENWVVDYSLELLYILSKKIDIIFHCIADFDLVDDGERSTDIQFRNDIRDHMEFFLKGMRNEKEFPTVVDLSGSIENRMQVIKDTISQYGTR